MHCGCSSIIAPVTLSNEEDREKLPIELAIGQIQSIVGILQHL